jgi:hypothetical protein
MWRGYTAGGRCSGIDLITGIDLRELDPCALRERSQLGHIDETMFYVTESDSDKQIAALFGTRGKPWQSRGRLNESTIKAAS